MANDGTKKGGSTDHRATYDRFMSVTKWSIIAIAIVLIMMALFLA